ncbi:aminodeoxychorismate synthase component I [Malaciobacter molluscorum LMG 25693]|uniref:Aminodeoxychorismate synthase component I n=1 Tax=Malaciobacter molluscorum LMG 25693 TaxID=870501 RepID=A0A2G1DGZ2_9BACT|nr:aminodeoxychorismate synthase component I [Malaciobacter molluscorum]AXX93373.1 aminodeoxychorismate synthase, component I [Malaciobacter molluscorum LMG 25693]PHO17778.1 aminodeoxychorismate synthase component I [Malaciobacter molluscorum LMG 25693]
MNKKEKIRKLLNKNGSESEPFFFMISYDLTKYEIIKLNQLPKDINFELSDDKSIFSSKKIGIEKFPLDFKSYKIAFDKIQKNIKEGNSYLLNLTIKTKIDIKLSLDEIYKYAKSKFKLKYKDEFVCFSPEKFVDIENNKIFTYPMKGTIDANIEDAQKKILANKKEMAEHTMVVDLLRNDLSIVSSKVRVEKFRYCEKISAGKKDLLQVSSKIKGELNSDWKSKIGDILTSLLPAGSITGTPKIKTVEILKDVEKYDRDYYTGIAGIFDGENLYSFVLIRFIEKIQNELYYKSGGGITCDSDAILEYKEALDKIYIPT